MGYRQVRTGNGPPMHAAPWNLPSAYDALELQIKRVDEFLETRNFQHPEISLEAIIHWVKHLGWFYIDVAYSNWVGYDPLHGWMGLKILQRLTSGRTHLRHFQRSMQMGIYP